MFDKRKDPRKKLIAFTPVYSLRPRTLLGYLEDLTVRGARVVGEKPLEANAILTLSIEFPKDTTSLPTAPFTIHARVAQTYTDDTRYENHGLEFVDTTPEQTAILEAVIQRYEFGRGT